MNGEGLGCSKSMLWEWGYHDSLHMHGMGYLVLFYYVITTNLASQKSRHGSQSVMLSFDHNPSSEHDRARARACGRARLQSQTCFVIKRAVIVITIASHASPVALLHPVQEAHKHFVVHACPQGDTRGLEDEEG